MKVLYTRLAIYRDSILIYISINHFKKTIFILFFIYNFNKIKNSIKLKWKILVILLINKLYETNYIYLIFFTWIKFKFNLLYKMNNLRNIFKYTFLVRKINFSNQFRQ